MLEDVYKTVREKMEAVVDVLRDDFAAIRTGRASVTLMEKLKVSCYNTVLPLNQVATINVPDPHQIIVQPWDKGVTKEIEKAIFSSELGLSPVSEGDIIRISIPPLSAERREDLTKVVSRKAEEGKVAIRNVRRDSNDAVKKLDDEGKISEDEGRKAREKIQEITDGFTRDIDSMAKNKEDEITQF